MTFSCSIQVKQALKATLEDLYKNKYKVKKKILEFGLRVSTTAASSRVEVDIARLRTVTGANSEVPVMAKSVCRH